MSEQDYHTPLGAGGRRSSGGGGGDTHLVIVAAAVAIIWTCCVAVAGVRGNIVAPRNSTGHLECCGGR